MFSIGPTPFDVNLVAFRIPIRIHPTFWLMAALLTWDADRPAVTFIGVMCIFVSVLVHELGHAFTAELFGWPTQIFLYLLGGLAISDPTSYRSPGRNITVSIMGPAAGFLLLILVICVEILLDRFHIWDDYYRHLTFHFLKFVNLYWGLFNLLPMLPLDGGHICQSFCHLIRLRDPDGKAMIASIVVGGAAAFYFLKVAHQQYTALMLAFLTLQNLAAYQARR